MNQSITQNAAGTNPGVDLSIIIVSYNTRSTTRKCLEVLECHRPTRSFEVILVDNASTDGSADMVERDFPWVRLVRLSSNKGFAGGNNEGIRRSAGRYVLLLNSDAFVGESVIDSSIEYMEKNPSIGVLGCTLTGEDGSMQASARMLPCITNKVLSLTGLAKRFPRSRIFGRVDYTWWDHSHPLKVGWVVGAYFLIRREVLERVGMLDERYFLYFEEVDFCRAVATAGWDVVYYPHARVVHLGGQSIVTSGKNVSSSGRQLIEHRIKSELRYYRKWDGIATVVLAALVEIVWNAVVFLKNLPGRSDKARIKRDASLTVIRLVSTILVRDRLGKGAMQ